MDPFANIFFPANAFQASAEEEQSFENTMRCFAAHEREEQQFLDGYRDIVERHENPLVRFLLKMIMADEEKHHDVVRTISSTLGADLAGRRPLGEAPRHDKGLPMLGRITDAEKETLIKLTAEFIQMEKDGIKEYKALLKPSANYYGGILVLLIQTIIHDSEKHLMILRFIDQKLRER